MIVPSGLEDSRASKFTESPALISSLSAESRAVGSMGPPSPVHPANIDAKRQKIVREKIGRKPALLEMRWFAMPSPVH